MLSSSLARVGLLWWAAAPVLIAAPLEKASITEAVNTVSYQENADSTQKPATPGTTIYPSNIVRTGVASRAELQFNDDTIARMGANSVFSFDAKAQSMNLQQGTALFSKPKNADTFQISTPAATCSITGTTGFISLQPVHGKMTMIFGLVEGHTTINVGGKLYPMTTGQMLVSTGGLVRTVNFNLASFLGQAGLMTKFKSTLPNHHDIDKALKRFGDLQKRGFIEPTAYKFAMDSRGVELGYTGVNVNQQQTSQIASQTQTFAAQQMGQMGSGNGFVNLGGGGIIHGQLVWYENVDLDLHLVLPASQGQVYYGNRSVTFNGGQATAMLDVDDTGAPNGPGNEHVENIAVTGNPSAGVYNFSAYYYGNSYSGYTGPVAYTITTTGNGGSTTTTTPGTFTSPGQSSGTVPVTH